MPYFDQNITRQMAFQELVQQAQGVGMRNQLTRFVGHGAPMARVLFVGQELAVSPHSTPHFQDEIGNNLQAWDMSLTLHGNHEDDWTTQLDPLHETLTNEFHFSPIFPAAYFAEPKSLSHTWGRYSRILFGEAVRQEQALGINNLEEAFTHKCFITEWRSIPAPNSQEHIQARQAIFELLQNNGEALMGETPETMRNNLQAHRTQFLSSGFFFRSFRLTFVCNAGALPGGQYQDAGRDCVPGQDHDAVIKAFGFDGAEWNREVVGTARIAHAMLGKRRMVITPNAAAREMNSHAVLHYLHEHFTIPAIQ